MCLFLKVNFYVGSYLKIISTVDFTFCFKIQFISPFAKWGKLSQWNMAFKQPIKAQFKLLNNYETQNNANVKGNKIIGLVTENLSSWDIILVNFPGFLYLFIFCCCIINVLVQLLNHLIVCYNNSGIFFLILTLWPFSVMILCDSFVVDSLQLHQQTALIPIPPAVFVVFKVHTMWRCNKGCNIRNNCKVKCKCQVFSSVIEGKGCCCYRINSPCTHNYLFY